MRTWLNQRILADGPLVALLELKPSEVAEDRVFSAGSLTSVSTPKPFIVHLMGNSTDAGLAEEDADAQRQFWQIWVHDEPADYTRIDAIHERLKIIFKNAADPASWVQTTFHLERSRDFDDQVLGTIFKYARFQSILTKVGAA